MANKSQEGGDTSSHVWARGKVLYGAKRIPGHEREKKQEITVHLGNQTEGMDDQHGIRQQCMWSGVGEGKWEGQMERDETDYITV
jgi:hypothetical protein